MLVPIVFLLMAATEAPPDPAAIDQESLSQLLTVRRVYIDRFAGGETAAQMRDMILSGLQNAKLFVVTENQDKADAFLRGSAEDLVFTDEHTSSDSIHAQANLSKSSSIVTAGARVAGNRTANRRALTSATASRPTVWNADTKPWPPCDWLRKDGDVIWSTTQESLGGKFHGASADVADKVTKKLLEDYDRARKLK